MAPTHLLLVPGCKPFSTHRQCFKKYSLAVPLLVWGFSDYKAEPIMVKMPLFGNSERGSESGAGPFFSYSFVAARGTSGKYPSSLQIHLCPDICPPLCRLYSIWVWGLADYSRCCKMSTSHLTSHAPSCAIVPRAPWSCLGPLSLAPWYWHWSLFSILPCQLHGLRER